MAKCRRLGTGVLMLLAGSVILGGPRPVLADETMMARLRGFQEVPAVSSTGTGEFRGKISNDETSIDYELSYADLEGTTTLFAHIHLGQMSVNGGVSAFLCGGGGKPACQATSGTVTGTVVAADIIGPAGQGIEPGEFAELLRAIRRGVTYANVHTNKHPGGEIRGQIKASHADADD